MGFTMILMMFMVAILMVGLGLCLVHHRASGQSVAVALHPVPVLAAATIPVASTLFYLAGGYICLQEIFGTAGAGSLFGLFQIAMPLAAAVVCGVYMAKSKGRPLYFVLLWANLLQALLGLAGLVISAM